MADLNLRPVKEVTEASVVLKPTWVQEIRPYVSLASEVLSPQHACAVLTEDSVGSPLQTVSHLWGCCFLQEGAGLGFMRNASLRGSCGQALTIFQAAHRKTAQQNSPPHDFFLALLFLHGCLTDHH